MNIKIRETGEVKELSICHSGNIEWTQDLIGNAGALNDGQFKYDYDADVYVSDQDTYDWWAQYIADHEATEREIVELAGKLGISESDIRDRISDAMAGINDYEDHRRVAIQAMSEFA